MKKLISSISTLLLALPLLVGMAPPANAALSDVCGVAAGTPTVTFLSDPTFGIDAAQSYDAQYIGYKINSPTAVKNLWVKLDTFAGGSVTLAPSQPAAQASGDVAANADTFTYFLAKATATTTTAQTHRVALYAGNPDLPGATALCSKTSTFDRVEDEITANANKVDTITVNVPAGTTLGGNVTVTAYGSTGTVGQGPAYDPGVIMLTPAPSSTFPANAWRLVATQINFTSGVTATFNNVLRLTAQDQVGGGANRNYNAVYTFKAVGQAASAVTLTPIQYLASGTQIKETGSIPTGAALQPLPVVENKLTIAKTSASTTVPVGGGNVRFTVTVSNGAAGAAIIDDVVDTLPVGTSYVAASTLINGTGVADANCLVWDSSTRKLTYTGPHTIPGNGTKTFSYNVAFPASGSATYTNVAIAYVGATTIDATLTSGDNVPGAATILQGTVPPVVNPSTQYTAKNTAKTFTVTAVTDPAAPITSYCIVDPANSATCGAGPYTVANVGTWSINQATGAVTFTPTATYTGTTTIGVKATNSAGQSTSAGTQTVTVVAPPTVTNASVSVGTGQTGTMYPAITPSTGATVNYAATCIVDPADSVCKTTVATADGTYTVDLVSGDVDFTASNSATSGVKTPLTYRITDSLGQTATSTLTVTITAPLPTITGASATTTTTTPVTLSPTTGGTITAKCLIDAAANTCGNSVTVAGVGTFVLNGNGSVTFTAVAGYTGNASVDYQVTDGSHPVAATLNVTVNPLPASAPTPPPAPVITPANGSGPVNTPVTVNPTVTPAPIPGLCLIDPRTGNCKTTVIIPNVGTWALNSNGSVTFVPVAGWTGTTRVILHAWDGWGQTDDEPLEVTIKAAAIGSRPPRTITIGNFIDGSPVITAQIAAIMKNWTTKYNDYKKLTCVGYTEGPTVLKTDAALSKQRATNACNYIIKTLKMKYTVVGISSGQDTVEHPGRRRVVLTLTD